MRLRRDVRASSCRRSVARSSLALAASMLLAHAEVGNPVEPAPKGTTYTSPHFSMQLPAGWRVVSSRPEPVGGAVEGEVALEARADDGGYLTLWFGCPAMGIKADEVWVLRADESGRAVKAVARDERWKCTVASRNACMEVAVNEIEGHLRELRLDACQECTAGDGRFDVFARFEGRSPIGEAGVCVLVGDTRREDVDGAALRRMLATLRVVGETVPGPKVPSRR